MTKTREKVVRYLAGLDLGQSQDYSALCVVRYKVDETWDRDNNRWLQQPAHYRVGHMERIPLGTSYPDVMTHVAEVVKTTKEEMGPVRLIIDYTGVGHAIFDTYLKSGMAPVGITIHAGQNVNHPGRNLYNVPKRELVSTVKLLLQEGRLRVEDRLKHADLLRSELQDFHMEINTNTGHDSYQARVGKHDDMVLAVACAVWFGEQFREFKLAFA